MEKRNAEDVLQMMIMKLIVYLDELFDFKDVEGEQFEYGERLAYTECLEWIQGWTNATVSGLNFDVEKRYPL